MKILFLLTQDLESPSGVGRYFPLAKSLAHLGNKVTIAGLHSSYDSLEEKKFSLQGVDVFYVGQMHVRKDADSKSYFPTHRLALVAGKATGSLGKAALSIPADVVHICKPHPMNSISGIAAGIFRRECIFLDCDDFEAASGHFTKDWQKKTVAFFEDNVPKWVDHITTHNSYLRQRIEGLGIAPNKITYLPNGIDEDRFQTPEPSDITNLRQSLGLSRKKVVAYIGSLSLPSHPVDLLLESFKVVHRSHPETILLIVGGGDQIDILKQEVQHSGLGAHVCFTGRVPPERIAAYYHLADVVAEPVFDDPIGRSRLPLKLFESWASGVPYVTGDVGERRVILGEPPAGLLAKPGDSTSLSECIIRILQDVDLASSIRILGSERVKSYTWRNLGAQLFSIYEKELARVRR
jgi:glycosyltransferase involved in cell wall biosynthesis